MLIEHETLKPLLPYMQSYGFKGLSEFLAGGKVITATAAELYTVGVMERVGQLENALGSLHIAKNSIFSLATGDDPSSAEFRYHYENFLFRTVGVIDRSSRLVGASLLLDPKKYDSSAGNIYVLNQVKQKYPDVHNALKNIQTIVQSHKALRNVIVHSGAFSSREFGLVTAIESIEISLPEGTDIKGMMREHFQINWGEISIVIAELTVGLSDLLDSMSEIFRAASEAGA